MNAKLNKRERRAAQLLAHYATCERLARYLGHPAPDGKRISVALWKIEREANKVATAYCNGESVGYRFACLDPKRFDPKAQEGPESWEMFVAFAKMAVATALQGEPAGLFVNGDARGYALKIDPDDAAGKALIDACQLHTDWGRNGILSPEIDGN